jgi:hypothetical protein
MRVGVIARDRAQRGMHERSHTCRRLITGPVLRIKTGGCGGGDLPGKRGLLRDEIQKALLQ